MAEAGLLIIDGEEHPDIQFTVDPVHDKTGVGVSGGKFRASIEVLEAAKKAKVLILNGQSIVVTACDDESISFSMP